MWTLTVTVRQCCHLAPPAYHTFEAKKVLSTVSLCPVFMTDVSGKTQVSGTQRMTGVIVVFCHQRFFFTGRM